MLVPDGPVDGVGLLAAADFVVGVGGVMLREAAALGTPAYTLSRSAGPVEASLLADGRLKRVAGPDEIILRKKDTRERRRRATPGSSPSGSSSSRSDRSRRERLGRLVQDASREEPPAVL